MFSICFAAFALLLAAPQSAQGNYNLPREGFFGVGAVLIQSTVFEISRSSCLCSLEIQ